MHLSSLPCMQHTQTTSSSLIWSYWYLAKRANHFILYWWGNYNKKVMLSDYMTCKGETSTQKSWIYGQHKGVNWTEQAKWGSYGRFMF
jgi:hypothetical protein